VTRYAVLLGLWLAGAALVAGLAAAAWARRTKTAISGHIARVQAQWRADAINLDLTRPESHPMSHLTKPDTAWWDGE
jgi:hypothetical protein